MMNAKLVRVCFPTVEKSICCFHIGLDLDSGTLKTVPIKLGWPFEVLRVNG